MKTNTRVQTILRILQKTYPNAEIQLTYSTPWELLVAVMLSAQCTDKIVNSVTPKLFSTYPTIQSFARAKQEDVERYIHATGFFRNKAKNIINAAQLINRKWRGVVPKTITDMCSIPGVARKTANVVLANAYGVVEGIAVDTHVIRLSQRLRLVPMDNIGGNNPVYAENVASKHGDMKIVDFYKNASPEKIEHQLMKLLPKSQWKTITYRLIDHGRAVCKARSPYCRNCPLSPWCPVKRIT